MESIAGSTENWTAEQRIIPIDDLVTEKRTWRRGTGMGEETIGLYVGPLGVVRFHRTKPPVIGDLLPSLFWTSSRMSAFVLEESNNFPGTKGGTMRARVTYEDRYADGQLFQTEDRRLQCTVQDVVEATAISSSLSGSAARIECHEELQPDGRKFGPTNPQTWAQQSVTYAHWYVLQQRWSVPMQGQSTIRIGSSDEVRQWSSKVVSFR